MIKRYYIPTTDELHVGFEYEYNTASQGGTVITKEQFEQGEWRKDIITLNQWAYVDRMLNGSNTKDGLCGVRVRYLDSDDLKQFGYERWANANNTTYTFKAKDHFLIVIYSYTGILSLELKKEGDTLFKGLCKNRSELVRILKQTGLWNS